MKEAELYYRLKAIGIDVLDEYEVKRFNEPLMSFDALENLFRRWNRRTTQNKAARRYNSKRFARNRRRCGAFGISRNQVRAVFAQRQEAMLFIVRRALRYRRQIAFVFLRNARYGGSSPYFRKFRVRAPYSGFRRVEMRIDWLRTALS